MSKIIVRPPVRNEVGRVYELLCSYAAYDGNLAAVRATKENLEKELFSNKPNLFAYIAEEDGTLIGLMLWFYSFSSWQMKRIIWIEDLYVESDYRGRGIGRLFLEKARAIAQEQNCAGVDWHVRVENHKGKAFYRHMGASIDEGTLPVYWRF